MSQETQEAWGKLDRYAADPKPRLCLAGHCIDVAAVLGALLALPVMRRRLERLAGRALDEVDAQRLQVLAFLHDVGKAGAGFYSKALPSAQQLPRSQQGHTRVVAPIVCNEGASYEALRQAIGFWDWTAWSDEPEDARTLWLVAVSHHGQPITCAELEGLMASYRQAWNADAVPGYQPLRALQQLGATARSLWPLAWRSEPRSYPAPLQHAFAGLVSLADWIGSKTEPGFFPYDYAAQDASRWAHAQARAAQALRALGLDMREQQAALRQRSPSFAQLFDNNPPRPLQSAAVEALDQSLVVLEAETGSGKTEAALWRFKALFEGGEVDSLCFLLPTRIAASGIYQRLQRFAEAAFPDDASRPAFLLAVPSDLQANGAHGERGLADFEVLWPDAGDTPSERFWAAEHSKRYFAGGLVAGTIDQFLLSALRTGHAHMRAALALRSLVVVDEVHASDAYMNKLLRLALTRHVRAGGHAMLLSATLTAEARHLLLQSGDPQAPLLRGDAYPSLASARQLRPIEAQGRSKAVHMDTLAAMRDPARIAQRVQAALQQGLRVLVLRNTVKQAINTQQALEALLGLDHPALFRCQGVVALHHGRYALPDRLKLDAEVERRFGKDAAASREPAVLVGTQTLEISVDCDADLLITDLVPTDVLLQRIGRLHRHAARDAHRADPQPRCVLLTPAERDLSPLLAQRSGMGIGARSAYPNLLMVETTWAQAEAAPVWTLPQDNRVLVEAGCGGTNLQVLATRLGSNWVQHWAEHLGAEGAKRSQAEPVAVNWEAPWEALAPGELDGPARTRLGLDSVKLTLPTALRSPWDSQLTDLSVPAWMLGDGDVEQPVEVEAADGDWRLRVGRSRLRYNRWGLQRE